MDTDKKRPAGGVGYIGRKKERRFEDVGDAKERLLNALDAKRHVGGAPTLDDDRVWCPDGWTVMTLKRGANDRCAGQAYHVWYAPDGAKHVRRADSPPMNRGDAAAAAWIVLGDESRPRRNRHVDRPRRRVAATPRPGRG